jgi:OmpA-OmpF porin, OOP family
VLGLQLDPANGVSTAYSGRARYLLAKTADAHVAVIVGEDKADTVAFLRVVEAKPIETGKVKAKTADELATAIQTGGKVDIYGILFDFDQATVKPDSKPTLDEIAKLLTDKPDLKLEVVGHTDGKGAADYNLDLSNRRAASVVAALTGTYAIDAGRLASRGAGMSEPVASNDTDDGRAKNRRVELKAN